MPDLRHERARHHDRPVRDGVGPLFGRPPDARPLRQPRAQSRVGLVAGRDPAAPRGRDRAGGKDPQDRPGGDDDDGRGLVEPGRRPRGPQLRGDPQVAVRVRGREQRLRHQRPGGQAGLRRQRRRPGGRLRHARRHRRRHRRAGLLRGGTRCGRAGTRRRWPHSDRGEGNPAHGPLIGRPADEVPLRRGACGRARARRAAALPRRSSATPEC